MGSMEGVIHIRIDDRFIHGQVAGFWTHKLSATRILIANDKVAVDDITKKVLRLAAPAGVKTSLIDVERAARQIQEGKYAGQRVLVIVDSPADIIRLMDAGLPIKSINVGNIGGRSDRKQVKTSLCLNETEIAQFKDIMARGVEVTTQMVPSEPITYLKDFID